jgi:hypothetical protein
MAIITGDYYRVILITKPEHEYWQKVIISPRISLGFGGSSWGHLFA